MIDTDTMLCSDDGHAPGCPCRAGGDVELAPKKGHRPTAGLLKFGPRVEVTVGRLIRKTVSQMLCDKCGEPVIFVRGAKNGRWIHGGES